MQWLKQSTAVKPLVGPFVADTDGVTPVTFLSSDADAFGIFKQGSTVRFVLDSDALVATTDATAFAHLTLGTTDVDVLGMLTFVAQDADLCLPVMARFMVIEAGAYGAQITGTDAAFLSASDVQAELVTYDALKGTEGAWASDVALMALSSDLLALNNLASSDIQAELVTYDAATGTEVGAIPTTNLDSSDVQAELVTYGAIKSTDGALSSDLLALNNLASSDIQAELVTYDAATGTELAALNNLADTDILGFTLETGYTVAQSLKLIASASAGKASGGGTATIVFRDLADAADRITATVDTDGNRTAVVHNA